MRTRLIVTAALLAALAGLSSCGGSPGGTILPTVAIVFPVNGAVANGATITVTGTTTLGANIATLEIDGVPVTTTDGFATWQATITLDPGRNIIRARMLDTSGRLVDEAALITIENEGLWLADVAAMAVVPGTDRVLAGDDALDQVTRIDVATGLRGTLLPPPQTSTAPRPMRGLAVDVGSDTAWLLREVEFNQLPTVTSIDLTSGAGTTVYGAGAAVTGPTPFSPRDIAVSPGGGGPLFIVSEASAPDPLVAPTGPPAVFSVTPGMPSAIVLSDDTTGTGPTFLQPSGMVHDGTRLLVADAGLSAILAVDPATGDRTIVSSPTVGAGPALAGSLDIAFDPTSGMIWILERDVGQIVRVHAGTGDRTVVSGPSNGAGIALDDARAIDFHAARQMIVVALADAIVEIAPGSGIRIPAATTRRGAGPRLGSPSHLVPSPAGDLVYVYETRRACVLACSPTSGLRTLVSGVGRGAGPPLAPPPPTNPTSMVREDELVAMAHVPSIDRLVLFAYHDLDGQPPLELGLLTIDVATGDRVPLGPPLGMQSAVDLEYDATTNTLFMLANDALWSVDTTTGGRNLITGTLLQIARGMTIADDGTIYFVGLHSFTDVSGVTAYDPVGDQVALLGTTMEVVGRDLVVDEVAGTILVPSSSLGGFLTVDLVSSSQGVRPFGTTNREFAFAAEVAKLGRTALLGVLHGTSAEGSLVQVDLAAGGPVLISR